MILYKQHGHLNSHFGLWSTVAWPRSQDPGPFWRGLRIRRLSSHTIWLPQRVYPVLGGVTQWGKRLSRFQEHTIFLRATWYFVFLLSTSPSVDAHRDPEPSVLRSRSWPRWASTHPALSRHQWEILLESAKRPCPDVFPMWPELWLRKLLSSSHCTGKWIIKCVSNVYLAELM